MELVQDLENRFLSSFRTICDGLSNELPQLEFRIFSNSGGDLTPHPWHVLGVTCRLHRDWQNPPNEVMIQVVAYSLASMPELQAVVMWDYSLKTEFSLFPKPVPASDDALNKIEQGLPGLVEVLKQVVCNSIRG